MEPKEDLEKNIRASYDLIREYEEEILLTDDPQARKRYEVRRDGQWKLIRDYLPKYERICKKLGRTIPADIVQIAVAAGVLISSALSAQPSRGVARQIQLVLEGEISDFTDERRDILLGVLANVLQVEPSDIRILRVQSGSIRVTVEVPEQALTRLNSLSRRDVSLLLRTGVRTIEGDAIGTVDLRCVSFPRRLLNRAHKTLRDPLWQGIGAVVAIVALVVAICAWLWPNIGPILLPSPTVVAIVSPTPTRAPSPTPAFPPTPIVAPSPSPAPTSTTPPTLIDSADIRDGPGVEFRTVGSVQKGDKVEIVAQFTSCRGELWYVIRPSPDADAEQWIFADLVIGTIPSSLPTATPVPDEYTILALMDAEKRAVLSRDIGLIVLIFAPSAVRSDGQTGQVWPAIERYRETFVTERHEEINHANMHVTFVGSDRAVVTNDSWGAFVVQATRRRIEYASYQGDRWTFEKSDSGCWQITSQTYNVPMPCPYDMGADQPTIRAVIDAEAQAVLTEDLDIIREIFAPYAAITDGGTGTTWSDPVERYREKFENEIHYEVIHENLVIAVSGRDATVTNDSRGAWAFESSPADEMTYRNPGGDRWTLRKTDNGCWRIVDFTYNAH